jgi:dihydrofolate reductase
MTLNSRPKISVFIATSIDGYIAKKDGNLEWLTKFSPPTQENEDKDCGFSKFFSDVDVLVMGKNSYEVVSNFDTWPYEGKRVIVLSSTIASVCKKAELFNGDIAQLIEKLHAEGIEHIYVDGGNTISRFLNMGLIDQMIISIIPVVLGNGIPLFSKINNDKWCRLASSHAYSNGLVQLRYDLVK